LSKTQVLLFPSALPKKESLLWRWMQQHMPPPETGQLLQSMAGVPDDTLAAAVFMLDEGAAAAGSAAPFTLLQCELTAEQQQQQGGAEASSKAAQPRLASSAAGAADATELSALLRVSPPAGTADSWQCVLEAHPQGLDEDTFADMIAQASSSSSPSPVQSWVLPQLLDEDRLALLVCEPAAAAGSSAGDAATAVALVAAAEIAAIEALAARGEAAEDEQDEDQEDDASSSSSSSAVQQQLLPWELDEDDEDDSAPGQQSQSEVHGESQGQGGQVQGEDEEKDEEEEDGDTQWEGQEHDTEEEEEEEDNEDEAAAEEAACVPYMLWLCRSAAAAEQATAQHRSMLAAAGVRAVTLDAALVQQLVETNDRGIDLQDKLDESDTTETLEAAEEEKKRVQGCISSAERLLPAVVAAKAEYAAQGEAVGKLAAAEAAAEEDAVESEDDEMPADLQYVGGRRSAWLYRYYHTKEPWHECLPKGIGKQLDWYLTDFCEDAEAELLHDLEVVFPKKLAAAEAALSAAKQEHQEREQQQAALQQQLDAVQLQLGELYGALSGQLGGAAVVFAEAVVLLEAVESSEGVVDLGSVRWLVADSCRGLGDDPAAAAPPAAGDEDADSDDDDEEEEQRDNYYDKGDGYHDRLLQLAKLLPGGRDSDSSWDSSDAWQLQQSGQVARLVYITQVRCAAVHGNTCCRQFKFVLCAWDVA
jgi:hypothetical protein